MIETEIRKKLSKFSKAQIIDGIVKTYEYRNSAEHLISNIEYMETDRMLNSHKDAINQESVATKEYIKWRGDMIQKYGTDGHVRLIDIPADEIKKGAELEKRMINAREKERKLSRKIDNILLKNEVE